MDMLPLLPVLLFFLVVSQVLINRYFQGLTSIPGPWLASTTNLWRLCVTLGRRGEITHMKLHRQYGDVVRMGPNFVSITDLETVRKIFSASGEYIKSDMYPVQQTISHGKRLRNLFNITDESYHAKLRRSVAGAYSMSNLVHFEPLVNSTIVAFVHGLETRFVDKAGASGICEFGTWLHYFAFDVIGEITWSRRLGFVDQGIDVEGIIQTVQEAFAYFAVVGQMPWLDLLWRKNPVLLWLGDHGFVSATSAIAQFASRRLAERSSPEKQEAIASEGRPLDLLARFQNEGKNDPVFMNDIQVLSLTVSSVFAGADSTAINLRAIFYYLLKNPHTMKALVKEADARTPMEHDVVSWNDARQSPYLTAVINEALRIHPAVGVHLERVVPPAGLEVNGYHIPGGTIVGTSAWPLHAKEEIFGPKTDEFRPERWLEVDEVERKRMENAIFTFSFGTRSCIGKNISFLEMYKVVPTLLRKFEFRLAEPEKEWKLFNGFFIKQSEFRVLITSRSRS